MGVYIKTSRSGHSMKRSHLFGAAAFVTLLALPARAAELRLTIEGIRSPNGTILIGLYDSAETFDRAIELSDKEGFLNDPMRAAGAALKANTELESGVVFLNLDPGWYGIIVFQDENGNGRLDKNAWGVPTEPYGFSNDAYGFLGPPTFADAALWLDGSDKAVTVSLVYHGSHSATGSGSTELTSPTPDHDSGAAAPRGRRRPE